MDLFDLELKNQKPINIQNTEPFVSQLITKNKSTLRILHTADWHIGKKFGDIHRYDEFQEFLAWVICAIDTQKVDILIVAGDIFDTVAPSNKSQMLYYEFLNAIKNTHCNHIIITAGNHDSPTFLEAPKGLLKALDIHVIGIPTDDLSDEIITLYDNNTPIAIVCAIPYLRDSDIRHKYTKTAFGDDTTAIERNTVFAIKQYYEQILDKASIIKKDLQQTHNITVPIIATGHFFATGSDISSDDDGMRQIQNIAYVGNIGAVDVSAMEQFDYMALGHIHKPQIVAKNPNIRYSGSPVVMGFGEAHAKKYVLIVDFDNDIATVNLLAVPRFRAIVQLTGDYDSLKKQIKSLNKTINDYYDKDDMNITKKPLILGVVYTGDYMPDINDKIKSLLCDDIILVQVKTHNKQTIIDNNTPIYDIKQLDEDYVIEHVLSKKSMNDSEKNQLKSLYHTLVNDMHQQDINAL